MHIIRVYRRGRNEVRPKQVVKVFSEDFDFWEKVEFLRRVYPKETYSLTAEFKRTPFDRKEQ